MSKYRYPKASIEWSDEQLEEAGIDRAKLVKLLKLFDKICPLMAKLELYVYGESGGGNLIHSSRTTHNRRDMEADFGSVVAKVGNGFDGGGW